MYHVYVVHPDDPGRMAYEPEALLYATDRARTLTPSAGVRYAYAAVDRRRWGLDESADLPHPEASCLVPSVVRSTMAENDVSSSDRLGILGRMVARLQGEVPAEDLEAYRRAGGEVYQLLDQLELRRSEWTTEGVDAWTAPPSMQAALLCGWIAFALQTMGDSLLTSDYEAQPSTRGFVPPVTAQQILAFYEQVPGWLGRAGAAKGSDSYRLDVTVPAELPPWSEVEPCPLPHLAAMRAALRQLRSHATAGMAGFHVDLDDADRKRAHDRVHEVLAEAESAAAYGDRLWASGIPATVHEAIEQHAKRAVELFYLLGQLMAMPQLALAERPKPTVGGGQRLPGPGEPGFDPWVLTDPRSKGQWKTDRQAERAIELLWQQDPEPRRTLAVQAEIIAAQARGDIVVDDRIGNYFCCPWAAIYLVRRPVRINGQRLRVMQQFTFDVSGEEMEEGGPFTRRLLLGQFSPAKEIDYCLPGQDD